MKHTKRNRIIIVIILILFASISFAAGLSFGSADIRMTDTFGLLLQKVPILNHLVPKSYNKTHAYIIFQVRMPRVFLAGLVGAGLGVSGAVFQGLFQNPLADPHILGVSSGAALGATCAILLGVQMNLFGLGAIGIFAFLGAMLAVVLVYFINSGGKKLSMVSFLLTGTAIGTMLSAVVSLIMALSRENMEQIYLWTMGSFSAANWTKIRYVIVVCAFCFIGIYLFATDLNLLAMGEEHAGSLGVETTKCRKYLIVLTSLLVASCVSVSGIIGFAGLVVPHCVRFFTGSDYRVLLPASVLFGSAFMILCDTVARTVLAPSELPVGVLTSVVGGLYFIFLLKKGQNGKKRWW